MMRFLVAMMFIFASEVAHGYEVTGRMSDATEVTVSFEATLAKKFAFATDITPELQKFVVGSAAKAAIAEVDPLELRKDKFVLGFPLREALNEQLEYYGYKATDVKIISVKTERSCNGKVCRP